MFQQQKTYNSEWNIEGCHEEVTKCKVGDEKVCDGVKSPCSDDNTEDKKVSKEGNDNDEAINAHNDIVRNTELILKRELKILKVINTGCPRIVVTKVYAYNSLIF